jgi:hypothetical protein
LQFALDIAGFAGPVGPVADAVNAGISLLRGDFWGAGINVIAIVPIFGDTFKAGKMAVKGADALAGAAVVAVKHADEVVDVGKSLSRNLKKAGIHPPTGMKNPQAHHDLPQAEEFRKYFDKANLNINDPRYGRWVEGAQAGVENVGTHQNWSAAFNREWREFFEEHPNATKEEILKKMYELRDKFP